jgi:hypothetical protein
MNYWNATQIDGSQECAVTSDVQCTETDHTFHIEYHCSRILSSCLYCGI